MNLPTIDDLARVIADAQAQNQPDSPMFGGLSFVECRAIAHDVLEMIERGLVDLLRGEEG